MQNRLKSLVGREPARLDETLIRSTIEGRVVLVTGAAGSIGAELCRQIARFGLPPASVKPKKSRFEYFDYFEYFEYGIVYEVAHAHNDPNSRNRSPAARHRDDTERA